MAENRITVVSGEALLQKKKVTQNEITSGKILPPTSCKTFLKQEPLFQKKSQL